MATTKRKKPAGKGKPKAKAAAKPKSKARAKAKAKPKVKPAARPKAAKAKARKAPKPKKTARPKAARAAARRPAKTVKKAAAKTAKRSTARPRPVAAAPLSPPPAPIVQDDIQTEGDLAALEDEAPVTPMRSTTTLIQTIDVNAPAEEVYRAYMMAPRHSEFTGGPAEIDARVGGRMSAWNGYIVGEFLEIDEGRRVVQTWRTTEWPEGYDDSKLELTFTATESGTRLTMVHSNVPSDQARRYDDGWKENYWEKLREYLSWENPPA
jgi:uncharacterized protein YndB with AHSA1/START domain